MTQVVNIFSFTNFVEFLNLKKSICDNYAWDTARVSSRMNYEDSEK